MIYAIISDVHANLEALDRVLADARACGAGRFVCLGDVVGYGPRPAECVSRIRETCAVTIAGNHDDAVSGRGDASAFIDLAGEAASRHKEALSDDARAWLASLPYLCEIDGAVAAHGDVTDPKAFYYVENEEDAAANFEATDAALVFVGHTHVPAIFLTGASGQAYRTEPQDFTIEEGKRYIVNPGSVGYPRERDGKCLSSYVLYDTAEKTVCYRFLPFSVASVMQRGEAPKRIRKRVLVAAAAAIALLAGSSAWLLAPQPESAAKAVVPDADAALVVDRKVLASLDGCSKFKANLKLARGSAHVRLRIKCLSADGATLTDDSSTVKSSSTRQFNVADGAASAELTVYRLREDDAPQIAEFAPSAIPGQRSRE